MSITFGRRKKLVGFDVVNPVTKKFAYFPAAKATEAAAFAREHRGSLVIEVWRSE